MKKSLNLIMSMAAVLSLSACDAFVVSNQTIKPGEKPEKPFAESDADWHLKKDEDYTIIATAYEVDQRFIIKMSSLVEQDICFEKNSWPTLYTYHNSPDRGEIIRGLNASVAVKIGEENILPRNGSHPAHCFVDKDAVADACHIRLPAGKSIYGMLPFNYFSTDERMNTKNKVLTYDLQAWIC